MSDKLALADNLFKDQKTFTRLQDSIKNVLGPFGLDATRYILLAQRSVLHNPKLMECSALSVASSIIEAAIRGLEIGSVEGQAYLVPFKGECTLIIGYRGFSLMAWRDANIIIQSECVYAKDEFKVTKGLRPSLVHVPYIDPKGDSGKRGVLIAVYAVATLPDGRQMFVVHDREEIDRRRSISQARDGKAWTQFYTAMAAKGPIRQLGSQVIPQSIAPKLVEAAVTDERREVGIATPSPALALQAATDITGWEAEEEQGMPTPEPTGGQGAIADGKAEQSPIPKAEASPAAPRPSGDSEFLSAEGILMSASIRGKTIVATVDVGDQNTVDFNTFDRGLLQKLTERTNQKIRVFYKDNTKGDKTYHNLISVEAA